MTAADRSDPSRARPSRPFYGWWIVIGAMASTFLQGSVFLYGLGALFNPIVDEFGWTRAQLSAAVSLATLAGGIAGPFMGHLIDRFGPRAIQVYATASLGLGFVLMSWAQSLVVFYVIFTVFMGIGYAVSGVGLAPTTAVAYWFIRRRSVAMGIAAVGWGPGGLVWPFVLVQVMQATDWRMAAIVAGLCVWGLGLPAALLFRRQPERYGLLPDGDRPAGPDASTPGPVPVSSNRPRGPEADFQLAQAVRTPAFWLLSVTLSLGFMVTPAIGLHQIPFLIEKGQDPAVAAAVLGGMTLMSIPGRLVFGWLGDRFDKRLLLAGALVLQTLGLAVLINAIAVWHLVLYTAVFGTGYGGLRPLSTATPADFFGRRAYGSIRGAISAIQVVGSVIAPFLSGWIADAVGTYGTAFLVLALLNTVGVATALATRPPRRGAGMTTRAAESV